MPKKLLIIGAGTGGLILANTVARQLAGEIRRGEVAVTLLGDRDEYLYQPGLLYVAFDLMRVPDLIRKVGELVVPGVRFIHERAERIDPAARTVLTQTGRQLSYDWLVLATGSEIAPEEVPGLEADGHWFYTVEGAVRLRDALRAFQGGRVVLSMGIPHKCPVAPLEFVFMLDDWARQRGIRQQMEITYCFPLNRVHNIHSVSDWALPEFERRGITFEGFFNLESVDPVRKGVTSLEGVTLPYDLLVAVPPHKGSSLGTGSGLASGGNWLPTDRHTLQLVGHDRIFVLGDAAELPVPKAGSVAHFEAEVLAGNLVNLLTGGAANQRYDGKAFCFIETGQDRATYLSFDYEHPPLMIEPTSGLHRFKQVYNRIHWMNLKGIL